MNPEGSSSEGNLGFIGFANNRYLANHKESVVKTGGISK